MSNKLKEINKKLVKLNEETDEALEKISEQTEKLNQNDKDLTYMSVNLNYTLTLLKSIKYKINPLQYINSPNIDLDFSNLFKFKKNDKNKKNDNEKNKESRENNDNIENNENNENSDNDFIIKEQIMKNIELLKVKQETINNEISNQLIQIKNVDNNVDYNSIKINANNSLIDDLI
jgi:hypothetical protein